MGKWNGRKIWEHVIGGNRLTADNIDEFLKSKVQEDLHLDYKGRGFFDGKNDPGFELRKYAAGFANADGGVLILGIRERSNKDGKPDPEHRGPRIDGCPTDPDPEKWAADTLKPIAPQLGAPARIHTVTHGEHTLLVVAVQRAPNLVPLVHKSRAAYFLRIGHQTPQVEDYLVADLVLGRRVHPRLTLNAQVWNFIDAEGGQYSNLTIICNATNESLVWIENATSYLVGYGSKWATLRSPPAALRRFLRIEDADRWPIDLTMSDAGVGHLAPFATAELVFTVPVQKVFNKVHYRWRGVVFVVPRNSEPVLLQLACIVKDTTLDLYEHQQLDLGELGTVSCGDNW